MNAMNASADTRCMSQDVRYQFAPVDAGLDLPEVHQLRNVRNGCRYQFYKLVDFPSIELSPNCVKNITWYNDITIFYIDIYWCIVNYVNYVNDVVYLFHNRGKSLSSTFFHFTFRVSWSWRHLRRGAWRRGSADFAGVDGLQCLQLDAGRLPPRNEEQSIAEQRCVHCVGFTSPGLRMNVLED